MAPAGSRGQIVSLLRVNPVVGDSRHLSLESKFSRLAALELVE